MYIFSNMKQRLRGAAAAMFHAGASVVFVALALIAIQYEERIAPEMARVSDSWGSAATDLGRRLGGFAT